MKKIIIAVIVLLIIILVAWLFYSFGPFGFKNPKNYGECIKAGGLTEKSAKFNGDSCRYNGKTYGFNWI